MGIGSTDMRRFVLLGLLAMIVASGAVSGCSLAKIAWDILGPQISFSPPGPTTSKPTTTTTSAEVRARFVEAGEYRFTAKVGHVYMWRERVNGAFELEDGPVVFTGIDPRYCVELKIIHVETPVWFLTEGRCTKLVIHSPAQMVGRRLKRGEVLTFSVSVRNDDQGRSLFSGLRVPPRLGGL
jgi:hypothetical protein